MSSSEPREQALAALVVERATIKRNQDEAKKEMRETLKDLDAQIAALAAEIDSGQGVLPLEEA